MKKIFKKKTLVGLAIIGVSALIIWIGPLAPSKELVVITKQMPKLDGSEGTSIAYSVYYKQCLSLRYHPTWAFVS